MPLVSHIERNMLLNQASWGIHPLDHDDGSCQFVDTRNVLAFAGLKNWEGFARSWRDNFIIRPDFLQEPPSMPPTTPEGIPLPRFFYFPACVRSLGQAAWGPTLADMYSGNTCLLGVEVSPYIFGSCNATAPNVGGNIPFAANNTFLVAGGAIDIACGAHHLTLAEAQDVGYDVGSVEHDSTSVTPADVVAQIHAVLGF